MISVGGSLVSVESEEPGGLYELAASKWLDHSVMTRKLDASASKDEGLFKVNI